jgi:hypothetical protein
MSATIPSRRGERGGALILAMILLSVLLVAGIALLRLVGRDEIDAAKAGKKQQAQICADAGLQYGRMLFGGGAGLPGTDGATYENSRGWNDFLNDGDPATYRPGYRYDERLGDKYDLDGKPDFWVSIRDDDDERNLGLQVDNPLRDNNEQVILRSVCIRAGLEWQEGGEVNRASVETILRHVQGASGYGNAQITSNSPDVVGQQ